MMIRWCALGVFLLEIGLLIGLALSPGLWSRQKERKEGDEKILE